MNDRFAHVRKHQLLMTAATAAFAVSGLMPASAALADQQPATPAASSQGTLTGGWTDNCSTLQVTSSGWPEDYRVYVRWYTSADSTDQQTEMAPVNTTWSKQVGRKYRGFSYRIVDSAGNPVTPLRDQAAACVVVVKSTLNVEALDCTHVKLGYDHANPEVFRYVITTGGVTTTLPLSETSFTAEPGATVRVDLAWPEQKYIADTKTVTLADCPAPTPTDEPTTPAPTPTTPAPAPSTPAPAPSTPAPAPSTPAPAPSTPAPAPSTPAPAPTTPAPAPTTAPASPAPSVPKPSTPVPPQTAPTQPTQDTRPPSAVVPARPTTPMVKRTFQVDRYMPRTRAQARVVARLDDDRRLRYREDRPLWGASRWQFVTVSVPKDASKAQVLRAVNKATNSAVGDIRTTSKLGSARPGSSYTVAWELAPGADRAHAWGLNKSRAQVFLGRS
ncbi:hypothetical protein [Gephyromycinifex aptenodytis]|uniref:hypothetical protein n=1 Tax=Gephyromycinifex aptenodytis TaxID=2716227 RepID=UPI0014466D82|nr:hypothetical protein [Gephyromycinifex aptenodytis]